LVLAVLWCAPGLTWAQGAPLAFTGATIIPIQGSPIDNAVLVVQGGKITAVGAAGAVSIPADAQRIDATGKIIMPGLVDTHTHIGGDWRGRLFRADPTRHPHL
jgi:imidazolonepropionase-like amidohydrolase